MQMVRTGFALAVGIALAACGSGSTPATNAPAASAPAAPAAAPCVKATSAGAVEVEIEDFAFKPEPVQAKVGDTITWTNKDGTPHSAAPDDNPECATDTLSTDASGSITYSAAGTYAYHCAIHPTQMKGTIVVSG
ncbi:MAG: plastocyanin/azurin family copper-binding protein [Chloroflexota bacterium]